MIKPAELRKIADSGKIPRVVFLAGTDEYLARDLICQIKAKFLGAGEAANGSESWDGKEHALVDILSSADQMVFGCANKVLVVSHAEGILGEEEALSAYLKNPSPSSVVIFCVEKLDGRRKISQTIEKTCVVVSVGEQYEDQHNVEMLRILARFPALKFSKESWESLKEWVGEDLGALESELEKISLAFPDKRVIETADIEGIVFKARAQDVFELADAIARRDRKRAMDLVIRLMRDEGKSALELFGLLRSQAEKLYQAAELLKAGKPGSAVCQALRVPQFFCDAFVAKAKTMSKLDPARFFALLHEADRSIKTGLWKENLAAELLVWKVCK